MIFVDTSALIALGNQQDRYHEMAMNQFKLCRQKAHQFITTNGVLLEFMNAFGTVKYRAIGLKIVDEILSSEHWTVIFIDQALTDMGIDLFRQRMDKDWGLVDCISMIVAEQNNIQDIMTADHHFEQAGFNCLLK